MSVGIVCVVIPQVYYTPQEDQKVYYIICTSRSNPSNPRRIQKQQNVSSLIWSGCAIWLWTFIYSIERTVGWRMYRKKELLLLPLQRYSERSTTTEIFPSPKKKKKKKIFYDFKNKSLFSEGKNIMDRWRRVFGRQYAYCTVFLSTTTYKIFLSSKICQRKKERRRKLLSLKHAVILTKDL